MTTLEQAFLRHRQPENKRGVITTKMGQIKAQNSIWVLQTLGSIYALKTQNKIIATVLLVSFDGLQRYEEKRQTEFLYPSFFTIFIMKQQQSKSIIIT